MEAVPVAKRISSLELSGVGWGGLRGTGAGDWEPSGHLRTWGPPGRVPALSLRENQLVTVQQPGSLWGAAAMGVFQCPGGGRRRWVWEGFTLMNGVTVPQETPGSSLASGGHGKNSPSMNLPDHTPGWSTP